MPLTPSMPSPRSSPAMRPSSPLSQGFSGYKVSSHFDSLRPPSPRTMHSRPSSGQRRPSAKSLKLPALPRFHPANFPSSQSSMQSTPDGTQSPPPLPVSPRSYSHRNDLTRQLYISQRDLMSATLRASSPTAAGEPVSPRLAPLGSPGGAVTPLELEGEDGYLTAGAHNAARDQYAPDALFRQMVQGEVQRQQAQQPSWAQAESAHRDTRS